MDDGSRAIEALVERFASLLRASGVRSGLSDTEIDEVTQELRVRVWKQFGDAAAHAQIQPAFVQQVVRTAIVDRIRRRREHRDGGSLHQDDACHVAHLSSAAHDPATRDAHRQLGEAIERAIQQLSDTRRPIVRMWLAGYSRQEIADSLAWTEAKVRNLLYRGLDDLRAQLRADGVGTDR